jgi:hypothetical protein
MSFWMFRSSSSVIIAGHRRAGLAAEEGEAHDHNRIVVDFQRSAGASATTCLGSCSL